MRFLGGQSWADTALPTTPILAKLRIPKIFLPPVVWGLQRSHFFVEITLRAELRRKWLGEVSFCQLTWANATFSTTRNFSSFSKATMKPVTYFNNRGGQTVARPAQKFGGGKMFDCRWITLFCLEKRLSKHKMTTFSKNFGGTWPLWPHGYVYVVRLLDQMQWAFFRKFEENLSYCYYLGLGIPYFRDW